MSVYTSLLALLLCTTIMVGSDGDTDHAEQVRRAVEGGVDTPEEIAAVEATIAALEANLGGLVRTSLAQRMAFYDVPGMTMAVIRAGQVEWVEAYGISNLETGEPMRRHLRLQAASISKPVTAMAIMRLVEQGFLSLDAPINEALSSWQLPENNLTASTPVTLRHILSHTSGVNNEGFQGYPRDAEVPSLAQILDGLPPARHPPIQVIEPPGWRWHYSSGAYTILQQVIEDLTGETFKAYVENDILRPANMQMSTFAQPLDDASIMDFRVASLHGVPIYPYTYPELPAAGMWSTALDLARLTIAFQKALAGEPGALLSAATAAEMVTPQWPAPRPTDILTSPFPGMGLGWFLADGPEPTWFWHRGGNAGYSSLIVGDLQGAGHGVAVMTNAFSGGQLLAWEIVNAIADLHAWPGWENWGLVRQ